MTFMNFYRNAKALAVKQAYLDKADCDCLRITYYEDTIDKYVIRFMNFDSPDVNADVTSDRCYIVTYTKKDGYTIETKY